MDDIPRSLTEAARQAATCTRCDLYKNATQTVFGEGPADARLMMVGEQPGDQEDIAGHPFVGPAGRLLDRALSDAGIDRRTIYVTNGVKHFKNEQRGRKRLHKTPNTREIDICRWWLDLERAFVKPAVIVALGSSAVRSLLGKSVAVGPLRGKPEALPDGAQLLVTVHPSYLLRLIAHGGAEQEYGRLVGDLKLAAKLSGVV